uniref:Uncharacterized protein n=1 Tax=Opuntia streptacantha TaxID=393608 RepID=A0A7C8Z648_OPUST
MAMEFSREDFEESVRQGLKVSHGLDLDILADDEVPSMLPRAPVAFAFVTEGAAVNAAANVDMPAMIPLPMAKFSVKARVHHGRNFTRVMYKATWSVRFVKPSHLCHILLAVPAPMASGNLGIFNTFRIGISNCSKSDVKPCSTYEPMFDDVYFIERPQVNGGAEVCAYFSFNVEMRPSPSGVFSFSIPLYFPFYTKGFYGDKQLQVPWFCFSGEKKQQEEASFVGSPFKIKLFICAEYGLDIRDCSYNFPLQAVMQYEDYLILLQELEGPDLEWPEGILTCSFSLTSINGRSFFV